MVKEFEAKGRIERSYLPIGPSATPQRATAGAPTGARSFSTVVRRSFNGVPGSSSREYATAAAPPPCDRVPVKLDQVDFDTAL